MDTPTTTTNNKHHHHGASLHARSLSLRCLSLLLPLLRARAVPLHAFRTTLSYNTCRVLALFFSVFSLQ